MKYRFILYPIFLIFILPMSLLASEKWTVYDVYKKRHWKIISYEHDSQGYSILMKQIRHYLITKVDKGSIQAEVDYKFCSEYRYKVAKKNDVYKVTHQFFSKFGTDGTIEFPNVFQSDMKSIDPHFENFMREMLGIPQKNKNHLAIKKQKEKQWKFKPLKNNRLNIWRIKSLDKYKNYYEIVWNNKYKKNRHCSTYIFEFSEKYFLLDKFLKNVNKNELIKQYWNDDPEDPEGEFFFFLAEYFQIKKSDIKFPSFEGIYREVFMLCVDEKKHPIVKEFKEYLKKIDPNLFKSKTTYLRVGCIYQINSHYSLKFGRERAYSFGTQTSGNSKNSMMVKKFLEIAKHTKIRTFFVEEYDRTAYSSRLHSWDSYMYDIVNNNN